MTVRLTKDKSMEKKARCVQIVNSKFITVRKFTKLIGMLVASESGRRGSGSECHCKRNMELVC